LKSIEPVPEAKLAASYRSLTKDSSWPKPDAPPFLAIDRNCCIAVLNIVKIERLVWGRESKIADVGFVSVSVVAGFKNHPLSASQVFGF
jgi:hypothetical protein